MSRNVFAAHIIRLSLMVRKYEPLILFFEIFSIRLFSFQCYWDIAFSYFATMLKLICFRHSHR